MATPGLALAAAVLAMFLMYGGGSLLHGQTPLAPLLVAELGFILLPTLAIAVWGRLAWRETFCLKSPSSRGLLAAALIGGSAWAVADALARLVPPPPEFVRARLEALLLDGRTPLWLPLLAVALLPAVCEEPLFRGLILSGLRPLGRWPAVAASALLFAFLHGSIYQLLPTFFLGVLLGWLVVRTGSLVPSVLAHALNNAIALATAYVAVRQHALDLEHPESPSWGLTILAGLVVVAGLALLGRPAGGGHAIG